MSQVGHLLPGITTVTSHARYYTLHAFVFAEALDRGLDGHATRQLFRRAEVLVGAVSIAHQSSAEHSGLRGIHGGERLDSAVASGRLDLDAMSADRGYVQADWGFWGPYGGSEFTLGLLATDALRRTVPGPEADLRALRKGFDGLLDLTQRASLGVDDLAAASHLCVCQGGVSADGGLLRRLLIDQDPESMFASDRRGQTLRLLLRLADLRGGVERPEVDLRRALTYGPERDDSVVAGLDSAAAWTGVLLRNELVAAWRNLWAHLVQSIDGFMSIDSLGAVFADGLPGGTVGQFTADLPTGFDEHRRPVDAASSLDSVHRESEAVLMARLFIGADRYGNLEERPQAYFQAERDEHLQQLTPEWTQGRFGDWADRPLRDFAVWLVHQLVDRAERIALTKATFDTTSGRFKVPTRIFVRDGFVFRDSHEGGGGVALRWDSAFQIMAGLGLVEHVDGRWRTTELGRTA